VSDRARGLAFGTAAVLVLAGIACAVLVSGVTGEVLTIVLISAGFTGALLLLFLEVGLGEEHDLEREQRRRERRSRRALELRSRSRLSRKPRRPR